MVAEVYQTFWAAMARGEFITGAAAEAGTYRAKGRRWLRESGGVRPRRGRDLKGRCLTFAEREEIAMAHAAGHGVRQIAHSLGRSPSTVSRELQRNIEGTKSYRATTAHALAYERASRPKAAKLTTNLVLRAKVEKDLEKKYSPEQITGRLRVEFPDDLEMRVSPETIYQSLYVQSRGALRRDLAVCLRTGRALRRPSRKVGQRKNRIPNLINIAERPPEVEDRAVREPIRCGHVGAGAPIADDPAGERGDHGSTLTLGRATAGSAERQDPPQAARPPAARRWSSSTFGRVEPLDNALAHVSPRMKDLHRCTQPLMDAPIRTRDHLPRHQSRDSRTFSSVGLLALSLPLLLAVIVDELDAMAAVPLGGLDYVIGESGGRVRGDAALRGQAV